jgi:hypothetical protein
MPHNPYERNNTTRVSLSGWVAISTQKQLSRKFALNTCPNCKKHDFTFKEKFSLSLKKHGGKCPECGTLVRLTTGKFILVAAFFPSILPLLLAFYLLSYLGLWGFLLVMFLESLALLAIGVKLSSIAPAERKFSLYRFLNRE